MGTLGTPGLPLVNLYPWHSYGTEVQLCLGLGEERLQDRVGQWLNWYLSSYCVSGIGV